jgi:hypothetical protein
MVSWLIKINFKKENMGSGISMGNDVSMKNGIRNEL